MRLSLLFFSLHVFLFVRAADRHQLKYTLTPTSSEKGSTVLIKLEVTTLAQKSTTFFIPTIWGKKDNSDVLKSLKIKGGTMSLSTDSTEVTIQHTPGQKLVLSYAIADPFWSDAGLNRENIYNAAIRPGFLSFFTNSIFFAVSDAKQAYSDCMIQVKEIERMYGKLACSFGKPDKTGLIYLTKVRNEEIQNGILVAGDYRFSEINTKTGQKVTLAIRDKWSFTDSDLAQLIQSTIDQQRTFWNDYSQPTYLITISSVEPENENSLSYTGTGLHNSFAVNATNNALTTIERLAYLFHHELMHHWIGGKIINAADEELSYWFSEGFTDYFTRVNMWDSGLIDEPTYLELTDSIFRCHYGDERVSIHNDSIREHFWDDSYIGKLPYNRGSLFALFLDAQISKATQGKFHLKTVMQRLLAEANTAEAGAKQFHRSWLEKEVKNVSGVDIASWIDRYIIDGEPIPVSLFNEVLPHQLIEKRVKVFGFGFSLEKAENDRLKIKEIFPETGAAAADFKVGDIILGYDVYMQPDSDSKVLVGRDGKELWIAFHPFEWKIVPQFKH